MTLPSIHGRTVGMRDHLNAGSTFAAPCAAASRLLVMLLCILLLTPLQVFYVVIRSRRAFTLPRQFHRIVIGLMGFKVQMHGAVATQQPILFIANHASYLDIPVLGSLIEGSFIAKADVASWPLIGFLAKMQNTVFVERRAAKVTQQREQLRQRLAKGHNLVLFPEGTSSDGLHVLPFKSSLFSIAEQVMTEAAFVVQPVAIVCTGLDGLPITRALRPLYAWYGDMTLAGHLWNVLKYGRFTVDVTFLEPMRPADFTSRKELAQTCQQQVARGIEHSLRPTRDAEPAALDAPKPNDRK